MSFAALRCRRSIRSYNALYRPDLVREKLAGDPDGKVKAAAAKLDLNNVMASGSAPKVAITSPATGASLATDEASVEATVSDQGGGIGRWNGGSTVSPLASRPGAYNGSRRRLRRGG